MIGLRKWWLLGPLAGSPGAVSLAGVTASQLCSLGLISSFLSGPICTALHSSYLELFIVPFQASRVLTMLFPLSQMPFPYISLENSYSLCKTQPRSPLLKKLLHEYIPPLYACLQAPVYLPVSPHQSPVPGVQ